MGDLIVKPEDLEIVAALNRTGEDVDIPMPFERDIFLLGTEVAGTSHVENIEKLYDSLSEGDPITLVREPDNPYDEYAVRVEAADHSLIGYLPTQALATGTEAKIGYIPRINNKIIARLMDAGKLVYGVVRHKEMLGGYRRIVIKVYMKD